MPIEDTFWPPPEAFLDLSQAERFDDGRVRCTAVSVCDGEGRPTRRFYQGQPAHFFYEFEVLGEIGVPGGGVVLRTPDNFVVHGKNTFQYGSPAPRQVKPGTRLRYHHVIHLELAAGEYTFGVGLASTDEASYELYHQKQMSHPEFNGRLASHSRVLKIATLCIGLDQNEQLLHHGLVNLAGRCRLVLAEPMADFKTTDIKAGDTVSWPTLFHVTHSEAGGEWLERVLRVALPERLVLPQSGQIQFFNWPLQSGRFYLNTFVTPESFEQVRLPPRWQRFIVIRDLRDTLVSAYLNFKLQPPAPDSGSRAMQAVLQALDLEHGLLYLMEAWLPACVNFQLAWLETGEQVFRYEDLRADNSWLERLLVEQAGWTINRTFLAQALDRRDSSLTTGHDEIADAETPGIWKRYFGPSVAKAFQVRYGDILIATGYEPDSTWARQESVSRSAPRQAANRLIYIASYPRSGNTWSRNLIQHYFDYYASSLYYEEGTPNVLKTADDMVSESFFHYTSNYPPQMFRRTLRNDCGHVLSPEFRQMLARSHERFFVKTHELPCESYFEGESVVYLVRHPCAVFWSYYHFIRDHALPGADSLTLENVIRGRVSFGSWSEHVEQWLEAGRKLGNRFIVFRYRDLAADEIKFCQAVAMLSGLPIRAEAHSFPPFEEWRRKAPKLYRSGKLDEWQKHFTAEQLELVQALHGLTMAKLGYTLDEASSNAI